MSIRQAALALATAAILTTSVVPAAFAADPAPAAKADAEAAPKPVIKRFGTWSTRCEEGTIGVEKGKKACHAFVDVRAGEKKERILYFGVGYVPNKKDELFAFAMTPLGSLLVPGVGINIDDKEKFGGPYAFCLPTGCQAEIKLDDNQVKALKSGKTMEVLFRLLGKGVVKAPIGLDGFSAAINSLPKP